MRLFKKLKKKKGFTLVELVVTIAIMLAIVSIAVPSAMNLTSKSKEKSKDLEIKEFLSAAESYVLDNKNKWNVDTIKRKYCFSLDDLVNGNYIKEIPKDPTTGEDFKGSVSVSVDNNKLKYYFEDNACSNKLVESGLTEKVNYDEYLQLNTSSDNTTGVSASNSEIKNIIQNVPMSRNYKVGNYIIEPGIVCDENSLNDGSAYCSFVGPVENNYIQISGITYPDDIDYIGQSGETIKWRIISFDDNGVKIIPDLNLYKEKYNDYSIRAATGHITEAVNASKLSTKKYSVYKIHEKDVNPLTKNEVLNFINESNGSNLENTTIYPIATLEDDYGNKNEVEIFNNNLLNNTNYYSKTSGIFIGNKSNGIFLKDSYNIEDKFKNNISYYVIPNNNNKYIYNCTNYTECNIVSSSRAISIKKSSNGKFRLTMIGSIEENIATSYILDKLNNWFNEYKNFSQSQSKIFSQTNFCTSNWDNDTNSFGFTESNNHTVYSQLNVDIDKIKNCNYSRYSYNDYSHIQNKQIIGDVGLLSIAEYVRMGGFVKEGNKHGEFKDMTQDKIGLFQNNTMFKYSNPFWTGDVSEIAEDNNTKAYNSHLFTIGNIANVDSSNSNVGLRPVVTINKSVIIKSGSGTRLDPWIIEHD